MDENKLKEILQDFVTQLVAILEEAQGAGAEEVPVEVATELDVDNKVFFDNVRHSLFRGRLQAKQVSGMEAKIKVFKNAGLPLSWAAYAMATSYHETAHRMQPVREGLSASENWRKRNLRYYPWYGRGDVQLTWEANYKKADKELGLNGALTSNLDLALDPKISAEIMSRGMVEGWFSGDKRGRHTLARHLPDTEATKAQFTQARRIINIMDKAAMIAGYAVKFQSALKEAGY